MRKNKKAFTYKKKQKEVKPTYASKVKARFVSRKEEPAERDIASSQTTVVEVVPPKGESGFRFVEAHTLRRGQILVDHPSGLRMDIVSIDQTSDGGIRVCTKYSDIRMNSHHKVRVAC